MTRTPNRFRWIFLAALCWMLAPCEALAQQPQHGQPERHEEQGCANTLVVSVNDDGIGGTGLGDDDGLGGTGLSEDGIGGTSFGVDDGIGGTGVFGTITGFGSICVNGSRIRNERDVSVMILGQPSHASRLGVGHVVWVVAQRSEPNSQPDASDPATPWVARSITAFNARVGRVDSIGSNSFSIDGETIGLLDAVWSFEQPGEPGFEIGDWVAVSGLRRADRS